MHGGVNGVALAVFVALFALVSVLGFLAARWRRGDLARLDEWGVAGLLATMPYIALQLVGIQVVIAAMGIHGDWPLIIAFVILAAYTYQSGLRAPALIAVVKDSLIYLVIIVALVYIPAKLGGFGHIFGAAARDLPKHVGATGKPGSLIPGMAAGQTAYATLALGSALALFMYPHVITGVLSSKSSNVIRRNATILPAYTFLLGLIALLGYMAIAAGIKPTTPNSVVPDLFVKFFPSWFEGVAFAAIAIGALVPAAVMSIAAANLFSRNVWREYVRPDCDDAEQTQVAKLASLVVKAGAVVFIVALPTQYAIDLQLLGGLWILQTLPAIVFGLYTRWLHRWALLAGWAVGMVAGTLMATSLAFKGSVYTLHVFGTDVAAYEGLWALALNLVVTLALTAVLSALVVARGRDETTADDYEELGERRVPDGVPAAQAAPGA